MINNNPLGTTSNIVLFDIEDIRDLKALGVYAYIQYLKQEKGIELIDEEISADICSHFLISERKLDKCLDYLEILGL